VEIPRQDKESLKKLVCDFLAGQVFFSSQLRDTNLLGMVFMPIALGALSFEEAPPETPEEPERPKKLGDARPRRPVPDVSKVLPRLEATVRDAAQRVMDLKFKVRWDDAPCDTLDAATKALDDAKTALDAAMSEAQRVAGAQYEELLTDYRQKVQAQRERVREWREAHAAWKVQMDAMADSVKAWEVRKDAYYADLGSNLGVIYAYMRDAGPRSINGYPMFSACTLLHKADWEIVRAAILREQDRMKNMEL
jgi:hypothetical protein